MLQLLYVINTQKIWANILKTYQYMNINNQKADIIISAVGYPELIKSKWIKPNSVVIDVGISSIEDSNSNS